MGCLGIGLAALLALAVPASIAPASVVGAYIVLALLAALAVGVVLVNAKRPRAERLDALPQRSRALGAVVVLTAVYAAVVAVIHLSA